MQFFATSLRPTDRRQVFEHVQKPNLNARSLAITLVIAQMPYV